MTDAPDAPPSPLPDPLSEEGRAELRDRELREAQAVYEADPTEDNERRLRRATFCHAACLTPAEYEQYEKDGLDLLFQGTTRSAAQAFAAKHKTSVRNAYRWIRFALEDRERLSVVAHRELLVERAEELWFKARDAGEHGDAIKALALASRLLGCEPARQKQVQHTGEVKTTTPEPASLFHPWARSRASLLFLAVHQPDHAPPVALPTVAALESGTRDPYDPCNRPGCAFCARFHPRSALS